jgi:hypothetical protein
MSGRVLATSAGQSVKGFLRPPLRRLVCRSQRVQVGWDRFYPLLNLWIPRPRILHLAVMGELRGASCDNEM